MTLPTIPSERERLNFRIAELTEKLEAAEQAVREYRRLWLATNDRNAQLGIELAEMKATLAAKTYLKL